MTALIDRNLRPRWEPIGHEWPPVLSRTTLDGLAEFGWSNFADAEYCTCGGARAGWHQPDCGLRAYEMWTEAQLARGPLAFAPETMDCYECCGFDGVHSVARRVVALGPIAEAHRDPTQTYKLACGHTAI